MIKHFKKVYKRNFGILKVKENLRIKENFQSFQTIPILKNKTLTYQEFNKIIESEAFIDILESFRKISNQETLFINQVEDQKIKALMVHNMKEIYIKVNMTLDSKDGMTI